MEQYFHVKTCCNSTKRVSLSLTIKPMSLSVSLLMSCQVGQARALYNFGNVYHAKGKSVCWSGAEPGDFPEEVVTALKRAADYYE